MSDYLEYFDFDAFSGSDEYTFDFSSLDNSYPIGEEERGFATNAALPPLPDVTAAPSESLVRTEFHNQIDDWTTSADPYMNPDILPLLDLKSVPLDGETRNQIALLQSDNRAPPLQTNSSTSSDNDQHDLDKFDHQLVQGPVPYSCNQCLASFKKNSQLEEHARQSKHEVFTCSCGKRFARRDAFVRHQRSFLENGEPFPCTFCKRHRGKNGFRRRDHLIQHLSSYHKFDSDKIENIVPVERLSYDGNIHCICPGCEFYVEGFASLDYSERRKQAPFKKRSEYMKHMREAHKVTPFPCPVAECKRGGANGYSSRPGLVNHLAREHETDTEYSTSKDWDSERKCDHCGESLEELRDFNLHIQLLHQS
ncbi:hypothetical protein F4805DRAFT_477296 [Annulohypoxylon moriforme]|nr:hypothetical protein F4805DRAFT_477296 [Annulohypoxylon moriforme]